jgi:hypothetical protein
MEAILQERIAMIEGYSPEWKAWQAASAYKAGVTLQPGEIIALGQVFDHMVDLETIAGAVLQEQHLRKQGRDGNPISAPSSKE